MIKLFGQKTSSVKQVKVMSKVTMCDPPSGWKYGFPKPLPADYSKDESIFPWLLSEGYPQAEIDNCGKYFYCRYWEIDDE